MQDLDYLEIQKSFQKKNERQNILDDDLENKGFDMPLTKDNKNQQIKNIQRQRTMTQVKDINSNVKFSESVYMYREYLKHFQDNKLLEFEQKRTPNIKAKEKDQEKNLNLLKELNFKVDLVPEKKDAIFFVENYEQKELFQASIMEEGYKHYLSTIFTSFQIAEKELLPVLGRQFFYFLTSNYKQLQQQDADEFIESDDPNHIVKAFLKTKENRMQSGKSSAVEQLQNIEENKNKSVTLRLKLANENKIEQVPEDLAEKKMIRVQSYSSQGNLQQSRNTLNNNETKSEESNKNELSSFKEEEDSQNNIIRTHKLLNSPYKKKRTNNFYNLPRYFMMLILELLSYKNLSLLGIPQGMISVIQLVRNNICKVGRKSNSKSNFYNHSHYSCLFFLLLQGSPSDTSSIQLLQQVFGNNILSKQFNLTSCNCTKLIISAAVTEQLKLILCHPLVAHILQSQSSFPQENTKVQYVSRVISGISKLNQGSLINRF